MAENIKKTPTDSGDKEEDPRIVAQRFLNIFHQLHIFGEEKRQVFNEMLLEQPPQVKSAFRQLPGGTILLDYLSEIENGNDDTQIDFDDDSDNVSKDTFENKKTENSSNNTPIGVNFSFDTNEFAKVLANTLAQSNAQLIKEFQRNLQSSANKGGGPSTSSKVELVTDESFAQSIADALSSAISTSEQKRLEDTKIIANSFVELQENINKMIEKNAQLKVISDGKVSDKAVSAFQFKDVVEDLVKAQTKFLKETSQSQKEEMASIVASAIKDSVKLSTQSLAETLKQFYDQPTPITYASPEQKKQNISEIEDIIKTQGREFYSIIAAALKESQKNSTQSIIKTIENLNTSTSNILPQKTEEIVKAQTQLFRDITREQNKEFSAIVTQALKEGQKRSADAIMALVNHLQRTASVQEKPSRISSENVFYPLSEETPENVYAESEVSANEAQIEAEETTSEPKKKKKKKKKNKADKVESFSQDAELSNTTPSSPAMDVYFPSNENRINDISSMSEAESWGFVDTPAEKPQALPKNDDFEAPEENLDDTLDSDFSQEEFEEKEDINSEWTDDKVADEPSDEGKEGKDWEWGYEEVDANDPVDGEEGKDWEWDYEEVDDTDNLEGNDNVDDNDNVVGNDNVDENDNVNASDNVDGEEGKDWEWDYEEVNDNDVPEEESNEIAAKSEIVIPENFRVLLTGFEQDIFEDPYLENVDDMY